MIGSSPPTSHCNVGTVAVPASITQDAPPGVAVTVYDVIGAPPLLGADHEIRAARLYGTAVGASGWAGLVSEVEPPGVTAADGAEAAELPIELRAITVNVVATAAKPVNAQLVAPDVVQVWPVDAVTT